MSGATVDLVLPLPDTEIAAAVLIPATVISLLTVGVDSATSVCAVSENASGVVSRLRLWT